MTVMFQPLLQHPNSNSIFIAPILHIKTDSWHAKQKTIIINLRHSKGQHHAKRPGKMEIRMDMLVRTDRF